MTSQHDTDWDLSAKGNWWRRENGTLIVGMSKYRRIWARVGDDFLDGPYDSVEEAQAAADSEGRKS